MKIKFGSLVVAGRGKIGGHVASKNPFGAYLRTKVTPTNPATNNQMLARNRFAGISSAWKGLTEDQRRAWNAAVGNFLDTDIFGDVQTPSGFNLHQKLNNNLLKIGEAIMTAPPMPQKVNAFTSMSIAADFSDQELIITYAPAIETLHHCWVVATPGLSAGISFVKSEYRRSGPLVHANSSPFDYSSRYIATFGSVPAAGSKIFLRMSLVNRASGQEGIAIQNSTLVVA